MHTPPTEDREPFCSEYFFAKPSVTSFGSNVVRSTATPPVVVKYEALPVVTTFASSTSDSSVYVQDTVSVFPTNPPTTSSTASVKSVISVDTCV